MSSSTYPTETNTPAEPQDKLAGVPVLDTEEVVHPSQIPEFAADQKSEGVNKSDDDASDGDDDDDFPEWTGGMPRGKGASSVKARDPVEAKLHSTVKGPTRPTKPVK